MSKLSRRRLLGVAAAMPIVAAATTFRPPANLPDSVPDPLIAHVEEWKAMNERVDALSVETDDLQGELFERAKALGVKGGKRENRMAEARAWRAKKREYDACCRSLQALTRKIRRMRATTIAGAIAKVELSLYVQYEDWSDHAFELIEDGVAELRHLTAAEAGSS